jgi:hypothetical protein
LQVEAITLESTTAALVKRVDLKTVVESHPGSEDVPKAATDNDEPISSLTFKLSLSEQEKAARSDVDLPYIKYVAQYTLSK